MISPDILRNATTLRRSFQAAQPFKHISIDGFFENDKAEALLRDFPSFDVTKAINEFGEVGGKAVHTRLPEISSFYAQVYDYLMSPDFLSAMTAVTGIEDLIPDPTMYGGGTHDNRHGQGLDPHVDFNQLTVDGAIIHRRANLLLYLNKVWDDSWGGAIELHSNPREPDINQIIAFAPLFNRAVLFETNEVSWHGFPTINLPEEQRSINSRKCLSVYLYTRERPAHEIAGTHGTFYVARPLSERFAPNYTLTAADVAELRGAVRQRDHLIAMYQRAEEARGREADSLRAQLTQTLADLRLPITGFARQVRRVSGQAYSDGWCGRTVRVELEATRALSSVVVKAMAAESAPYKTCRFRVAVDGTESEHLVSCGDMSALEVPVSLPPGTQFAVSITSDSSFNPAALGISDDHRDLAFLLSEIMCV